MRCILLLISVCVLLGVSNTTANDKKIVCYFGSWSVYRPRNGQFSISLIDPSLCTHLIYAFVGLIDNNIKLLDKHQDIGDNWGKDGFGRFNALRKQNPTLKTLLAIGGWNEGSTSYSMMAKNASNREEFSTNVVKFVNKYNFDGFDIDWEYPAQRGGTQDDKRNYVELLKVMRKDFDDNNLILSAAVASAKSSASKSYIISEISKYLDFINVMAYDLHGPWQSKTGINAPLYSADDDRDELNVKAVVEYWLSEGCPKEKLILGIPLYGRTFTLSDSKINKVGSAAGGPGQQGPYTREPGMLGYNEICEKLMNGSWSVFYDDKRHVPYAYNNLQWVGYENVASIKKKAELINEFDLGGAMVWSVDTDDFNGLCGNEKYPLLKTLNAALHNGEYIVASEILPLSSKEHVILSSVKNNKCQDSITEMNNYVTVSQEVNEDKLNSNSSTVTDEMNKYNVSLSSSDDKMDKLNLNTTPIAIFNRSLSGECTKQGNIPNPDSCDFIICVFKIDGFIKYDFKCPVHLCFNPILGICDWKHDLSITQYDKEIDVNLDSSSTSITNSSLLQLIPETSSDKNVCA